ncbi:MAG: hypothetical protein AAGM67_08105, partial [Bacteroidota bacterium]
MSYTIENIKISNAILDGDIGTIRGFLSDLELKKDLTVGFVPGRENHEETITQRYVREWTEENMHERYSDWGYSVFY